MGGFGGLGEIPLDNLPSMSALAQSGHGDELSRCQLLTQSGHHAAKLENKIPLHELREIDVDLKISRAIAVHVALQQMASVSESPTTS